MTSLALFIGIATAAQPAPLQTVDLAGMSTEGGEARLYRTNDEAQRFCTIDVIHYGETGKATYRFEFDSRLRAATKQEYAYADPIYIDPDAKVTLTTKTSLSTPAGRSELAKDFETYKALFDPGQLAKCYGN